MYVDFFLQVLLTIQCYLDHNNKHSSNIDQTSSDSDEDYDSSEEEKDKFDRQGKTVLLHTSFLSYAN